MSCQYDIESICKKAVSERRVLDQNRVPQGVITGIPAAEDLDKKGIFVKQGIQCRVLENEQIWNS